MYNLQINELTPGRKYYVKVRAKAPDLEVSDWSPIFEFTTSQDTVPPHRVGNLTFVSQGDSFIGQWNAPTINADGTPCTDLSHYVLRLTNIDTETTVTIRSSINSFTLDFNNNRQLFGTPAGRIKIEVAAVDIVGNTGAYEEAIAQNPAPAKVQNVSATAGVESINLSWGAGSDTDISHYEIHVSTTGSGFTPGTTTYRGQVSAGTTTYTYGTSSISTVFLKVIAVDKFNQKSVPSDAASAQPKLSTDYDKTPPGVVGGFTVTQVLSPDNNSSIARISYTPIMQDDLDKYEVQYRKTGETSLPWSFATIPSDQSTAEVKPLPLATSYDFRIRAVDFNANKGDWSSVVVAPGVKKTTLPAAPTGVTVRGGSTNLMITWTASTDPSMANWAGTYEVQISKAVTFTTPTTIKTSSTLASFINLDANTIYYARIRSIDPFGNIGAWSTTANGNTGQIADANASRVIWSDTAPTGGKTNDLWIKTPENVQYRYNGTTWIKAQDTELTTAVDNVRQTADGKNKVWYQTAKPPLTSNSTGDLWFDTDDGNKMYVWSASTNDWVSAQDQAIQDALDNADEALQTADGKNTIYYSTPPTTGLRDGDTWFDGPTIKTYRNGVWTDSSSNLETQQGADAIQVAGSKNKTYYTTFANRPTTGLAEGDLLFDTGNKYKQYRYTNAGWLSVQDGTIADAQTAANNAQTTADKKVQTFYGTTGPANDPVGTLKVNDLWIDSDNKRLHRWNGTIWEEVKDAGITAAYDRATTAIDSANAKNRSIFSTSNASGTSLDGYAFINGDMWYKKDANNTIIGMWEFLNGAWVAKTVNNEVIANLDAGKINAGTINADRIGSRSISASKLQISDSTNLVPDDGLDSLDGWRLSDVSVKTEENYRYIEYNTPGLFNTAVSDVFGVQPGEYLMEFELRKTPGSTGDGKINAHLELQNFQESRHSILSRRDIQAGADWSKHSESYIVPEGVQRAKAWLETSLSQHGVDVRYLVVKKKTGTTLIEDGAITTEKVHAEAITASELAAGAVTADKVAANSISAQKLVIGMGENFVNDPNFIADLGVNWGTGAGITITSEGLNNSRSLKIVGSTAQQSSYNQPEDSIVVEAGTKIRATVRVKSTGTIPANVVGIGFRHKSLTGAVTYPAYMYIPAQAQITAYKSIDLGIANIPSDGTLTWFIVAQAGYSSRTIWFDNVQIMRAVGTTVIADDAITTGKIAAQQITGAKIAANTITVGNMGPNSVDNTVIQDGAITTKKIGANEVKADNIDAGAITAGKIAAGAIVVGGSNSPIDASSMENTILQSRTKDYGYAYKTSITLYGDHDKYYPVGITDGDQNVDRQVMVLRTYSELHPPEWYSSTHGGGLQLVITANFGGWGGVEYKQRIDQLSQQYNDTLGDIRLVTTGAGIFVFLRGGGTTGARYHIYSDQPVEGPTLRLHDAATGEKLNKPFVFYNSDQFYVGSPQYTYSAPAPLTAPNTARIKQLSYVEAAQSAYNLTEGWKFTGKTTINGGQIETDTITALQIASKTITAEEIKGGTITATEIAGATITANEIKGQSITGDKLVLNTAIVNSLQIQSALTINAAGGHIKSSNWNDSAKTGFYMDQQQLIVHNGRIEAAAIKLQDSSNIMPPTYASFNARGTAYAVANMWTSSVSGITKFPADGRFGGDSLQAVITANTGFIGMGHSATDLNIPIEGGKQYIISFYVSNRSSKVITLQPELYQTASILIKATATSIANSTAWTRYSMFVTAPATMTRAILRFNLTVGATATFRLDGIQVEQKIGQETAPSNWSPPGYTSIDGESITTGAISSNSTISTPNGNIARWSIDTAGRARFADATIDGKLIVGADVSNKEATSIQSDTYSAGIAGWAIKGNGDVEFNNGTFRGILSLGTAANESIKPTMNASVSNVKLFINDSDHQDINVASIRGVTYAYDRAQTGGEGPYYPTNPVPSKIGRYYFGPTTDRSVNIQVHEGEEDAVYLETPPNDVALTSLFVGELTNPANEPVERERQGFGFSATRIEIDPSTPSRKSSTGVSQSSSVQLRSPFYPESIEGEYPESTHLFESKIDFRAPLSKNLFFRSYALPDLTVGGGTTSRVNRPDYVSRAYELVNPVNKSTYVKIPVSGAGNPAATKRHIFSVHVDTLDAFTDTAVYAFANNTPMNPIGDEKLTAGQTAYQHADTLSTLAPNYHYQFNTAAATYSNSGSGGEVLTRTHGSAITGPESTIFNSGNTRYTAPSTYDMSLGMSFSVWFQPTYVSGENVFFHRGTANMREIWIRYNATNRTFMGGMVSATMTTWSAPNNLIDPAKWNQVTFTFDSIGAGTKNMRIYVNGVLQFTQVMSGWTTAFSNEPLYLFSNLQATSFYLGGLSEPMVFHKVLTAEQVTSLYNRGTAIYRAGGFSTLSQNGILVESGNAAQRVAFEYTPSSTVATTITLQVVGASSNTVLAYKIQLERASYQENVNLPNRIREKIAPTPWMTNGSNSLSTASLKLKAEPSPDIESWSISSLGDYQRMGPRGIEANKKKSPAELELSLSSSYSHPGGGSATSASATYKWGTTGMSYPGSKFPFMPAAASIIWDYNSLASASRPPIGGSGNLITTINLADSSTGAINTGAGKSLEDTFTASNGTQLGYPWIRVGTPDLPIYVNTIRIQKFAHTEFGIPSDFVYNAEPLIQTNQEVHIRVDSTVVTFGSTYRYNGVLVINYDPNTDSGIFARVRDGGTRLWEVYVMNNGLITYSTSGTFTTAINSWTDFKLRRENSNVRLTLGNVTLFNGTIGTLPTGKYVGFTMDAGRMDDFNAYDIAPGSTAMGMLLPESVNVNEGRGIFVNPNGVIAVDVPGYYMVTGCVRGAIGGDIARTYWLEIFETRPGGNTKTHPISGWHNRSSSDMDYVFGSGICYLEGTVEFRIVTHTTNVSRISGADLHIVRMA